MPDFPSKNRCKTRKAIGEDGFLNIISFMVRLLDIAKDNFQDHTFSK